MTLNIKYIKHKFFQKTRSNLYTTMVMKNQNGDLIIHKININKENKGI